jgi:hypothetical protein
MADEEAPQEAEVHPEVLENFGNVYSLIKTLQDDVTSISKTMRSTTGAPSQLVSPPAETPQNPFLGPERGIRSSFAATVSRRKETTASGL